MRYVAKTPVQLDETAHKEVAAFLNEIDDHDDVHRVYAALA
jgi:transcriptional/translational regulatory protein YebC/TACO1